jgi:hypothetical protein
MGSYFCCDFLSLKNERKRKDKTPPASLLCRGARILSTTFQDGLLMMWEELVGPTLLTCDNVEVSTTEALKDKKYVM